ncbi:hypothetical protein Q7P37_001075 [Cladosporium fusiforme]
MRAFTLALGVVALPLAFATDAPVVEGNPIGTQYTAVLPDRNDTDIRGAVMVNTNSNGTGANVQVSISGLPEEGGPFSYHIHRFPVSGLNCTSTGLHLDPYNRTADPPCDPTTPNKCEVGDLSGKHGKAVGPSFSANYYDAYLATFEADPAYMGNVSVVVHAADASRLTCANFTLRSQSEGTHSGSGGAGPGSSPLSSPAFSSSPAPVVATAGPPTVKPPPPASSPSVASPSVIQFVSSSTSTAVVPVTLTRAAPTSTKKSQLPTTVTSQIEPALGVVVSWTVTPSGGQNGLQGSTITVSPSPSGSSSSVNGSATLVVVYSTVTLSSGASAPNGSTMIVPAPASPIVTTLLSPASATKTITVTQPSGSGKPTTVTPASSGTAIQVVTVKRFTLTSSTSVPGGSTILSTVTSPVTIVEVPVGSSTASPAPITTTITQQPGNTIKTTPTRSVVTVTIIPGVTTITTTLPPVTQVVTKSEMHPHPVTQIMQITTLLSTTGLHKSILKETHILSTVKASVKKITSIKPASVITKTSTAGAVVKSLTKKLGNSKASSSSSGKTITHKVSTLKKDSPATSSAVSDGLVAETDPALAAPTPPLPEQQAAAAGPAATATDAAGDIAANAAPLIETTFITQDPAATAEPTAEPTGEADPSAGLPGNATDAAQPTTTTVTFDGSAGKTFGGGSGAGVLGGLLGLGLWLV